MRRLEFSKRADEQLSKMDPGVRRVIVSWLLKNIGGCDGPRAHGKNLTPNRSGEWRYRIGDYRVLCDIQDGELVVPAIEIGHRREAHKKQTGRGLSGRLVFRPTPPADPAAPKRGSATCSP